ncbi:MAG TPA: hypothetical protein VE975_04375 [Actinomycetota bacterium]|nr:hypothetical protein [Actinomycetota bacterium]
MAVDFRVVLRPVDFLRRVDLLAVDFRVVLRAVDFLRPVDLRAVDLRVVLRPVDLRVDLRRAVDLRPAVDFRADVLRAVDLLAADFFRPVVFFAAKADLPVGRDEIASRLAAEPLACLLRMRVNCR